MVPSSVCIRCGACCASFRVSFHWIEADPLQGGPVPGDLVEPVGSLFCCMKGTSTRPCRCVALEGEVGRNVSCRIYDRRPTTCHEFGDDLERCDQARAMHGLPPLGLEGCRSLSDLRGVIDGGGRHAGFPSADDPTYLPLGH